MTTQMPPTRIPAQAMQEQVQQMKLGQVPWWMPVAYKKAIAQQLADFDYFVYATDFTPLVASTTTKNNITINGDSDFFILSAVLVETATDNTTFLANAPLLFTLTDNGSGRELSNTAIAAENWFGTAQEPKYWDVPKIIKRNSTFGVTAQNLEATNRNVRIAFHGFKVFPFSQ